MNLTEDEIDLLKWLGEEEFSQYGECHGKSLDALIENALAELCGEETETDNPFIAKGHGIMYRAVQLTDAGRQLRRKLLASPATLRPAT